MDKSDTREMLQWTQHRRSIYGLLASVYGREVTSDLLQRLKAPPFPEVLTSLTGSPLDEFFNQTKADLLEAMAMEYARLFLGPGKYISPHESVHHKRADGDWGKLWGAATVEVKKFIEATGLTYADDFKGMPDHIAAELEFMQKLLQAEELAWEASDQKTARALQKIENQFLEEHLNQWVPVFCEKVFQTARLPFYRAVANLTQMFLNSEIEAMRNNGNGQAPAGKTA